MKTQVIKAFEEALNQLNIKTNVELTPAKGHGDFSTNIAMKLAKEMQDSPINIANKIIANLKTNFVEKAEVAGPGFINIFLSQNAYAKIVKNIIELNEKFGMLNQNKFINVEYVSANPTGHLHLGHARGAAVGSTLVNILRFAGNKVDSEYYINDAGNQIDILGLSTFIRYCQHFGKNIELPDDSYKGQDIVQVANHLANLWGNEYVESSYEEVASIFKNEAKKFLLEVIKEHLKAYGVTIDIYSSEEKLYSDNSIIEALAKLKEYTYEQEGATWLKTSLKGDDKDRVLIKNDGKYTYFTPDITYHNIKLARGYDELINIWGADHIGYIKRMKVALEFLGLPENKVDILTIQLVKLFKDGVELKMSKRKGTSFTIEELIEEVGKDAARWFMIDRAITSEFIFDINEATKKSSDNPVYNVQYTHARANQLIKNSQTKIEPSQYEGKEIEIINTLVRFPQIIEEISLSHKVNILPQYLLELAREFNSWYSNSKAIGHEREASLIALVHAVKIVLNNGLKLLEINAPEKM